MKIVYVSGYNDFSALDMEESGELTSLVLKMLDEDITEIESEDQSRIEIIEVGEVDDRFIRFVRNNVCDYDLSKMSEFYLLDDILKNV